MDKTGIPTKTITLGKGKGQLEVKVYEYLTQEEEDQRIELMTGENDVEIVPGQDPVFKTKISNINRARDYLISAICVDLTPEKVNIMPPKLRKELTDQLQSLTETEKKG